MAKNKMNLQIITPFGVTMDEMVEVVVLNTTEGEMGVLYDHEPVVALLTYGAIRYKNGKETTKATIMSGFAEVTKDRVMIMTDASELADNIDKARAEEAKKRAENYMHKDEYDKVRAEIALKKSLVRLNIANKK